MATPIEVLKTLIDLSPHTTTSASKAAGLGQGTIGRWLSGQRHPRADELDRALKLFGYELSATKSDKPRF